MFKVASKEASDRIGQNMVAEVRNTVCQLFSSVQKQGVQQTCERTCALKKFLVFLWFAVG